MIAGGSQSPSRLREGLGVGLKRTPGLTHPQPLPQAGGEFLEMSLPQEGGE